MHINYHFLMDVILHEKEKNPTLVVLDYGCGSGEVVKAGQEAGVSIFGAEIFAVSDRRRRKVEESHLLGSIVREIKDGRLDFPDATFDLVVSNQVFEHVKDLQAVLTEIHRTLKPGGKMVCLFPSRDVWREGHTGIPFLHRFHKNSRFRYFYAKLLHSIGIGTHGKGLPPGQAARNDIDYLDEYCSYRPRQIIKDLFQKYFSIHFIEHLYILYRLESTKLKFLEPVSQSALVKPLANELFRKLGGLVILAEKAGEKTVPTTGPARPIPESYWVIQDQFLAGFYPTATYANEINMRKRILEFLNAGFDTFFDLTSTFELPPYQPILDEEAIRLGRSIHYQRFPIPDKSIPEPKMMKTILDAIDIALAQGHKVYLHCWGGIGRTGTTVGCYLVRHGLEGEAAHRQLNELYRTAAQSAAFPTSPETIEQVKFILKWSENQP